MLIAMPGHACPDMQAFGQRHYFSGDELMDPVSFRVDAGGNNSVLRCAIDFQTESGPGYVTSNPDHSFRLSDMDGYGLRVSVTSECDSVLVINTGAGNQYYDDDDRGESDAQITLSSPSDEWLDVWVGTYDGRTCNARVKLQSYFR